jgi:hypothetical protein
MRGGAKVEGGAETPAVKKGKVESGAKVEGGVQKHEGTVKIEEKSQGKTRVQTQDSGSKPSLSQQGEGSSQRKVQTEDKSKTRVQTQDSGSKPSLSQQGDESSQRKVQTESQGGSQRSGQTGRQESTGKKSGASVSLSNEQRTRTRDIIVRQNVRAVNNVNFTIRVGSRVPRSIHFYPLPLTIIEFVPEYEGYQYILVGNEILIIDPVTLEIVAVLQA